VSLPSAAGEWSERTPVLRVGLSLLVVGAVVAGFYQIDALEAWVQYVAQHHVAPVIGLEE